MIVKNIYILIEKNDLENYHFELVNVARKFANAFREEVWCISLVPLSEETIHELGSYGADTICILRNPMLQGYCSESAEAYLDSLQKLIRERMPRKILIHDDAVGTDLACRLAARLKVGIITGCVKLSLNEKNLAAHKKLVHEGRATYDLTYSEGRLDIVTLKTGFEPKENTKAGRVPQTITFCPEIHPVQSRVKSVGIYHAGIDQIELDEADIIIAGGRGMGNGENFLLLNEFAQALGGVVAGSLAAVEEGWIPRNRLVGQTGMTVEPRLYIACGISGSIYHLLGMRGSRLIIAINRDRYAPIFKCADLGIVGDALNVIPSMIRQLKAVDRGKGAPKEASHA